MKILLTSTLFLIALCSNLVLAQECCTEEILKFEKILARKYQSYKRIPAIPRDGEINSMREIFYAVEKKGKHGIINGERVLIYGAMWDDLVILETNDFKENYTFFKYGNAGKLGIGSVQDGLQIPAKFESVEIRLTTDPSAVFLIGKLGGQSRVDWKQKGSQEWFSKEVDFIVDEINLYTRNAVKRYTLFDNLVFFGGKNKSICYELKTGIQTTEGPIGYVGTVDVDAYNIPALLCLDHQSGFYQLMTTDADGKFKTVFSYNQPIVSGHLIEGGLIIAKTIDGQYKLPLGKLTQDFQLGEYDRLYHSGQNLFLINGKNLVVINKQATKQVVLSNYFEIDRCGNYQPKVHITEEEQNSFGRDIPPLQGGILVDRKGIILNDSLYLMDLIDRESCLYLFWRDEQLTSILGIAAPKNKRGLLNGKGEIVLPEEYSAIWKTGDHYLTMKGGKVTSTVLLPTVYEDGEWILYDSKFNPIKDPVRGAIYQADVIFGRDGFKVGDDFYTTYEFTSKYFGIGVR